MNIFKKYIREIENFPQDGISFKDIQPLLNNPHALRMLEVLLFPYWTYCKIDSIAALDARGFIFATMLSRNLGSGISLIRKSGKLPGDNYKVDYNLEYGSNSLELSKDFIKPGQSILIVDDVLATGGTLDASIQLLQQAEAKIVGIQTIIELSSLNGREMLLDKYPNMHINTVVEYEK